MQINDIDIKKCTSNISQVKRWFKNSTNIPLSMSYLSYNLENCANIVHPLAVYHKYM